MNIYFDTEEDMWCDIPNYENSYEANNNGKIRNKKTKKYYHHQKIKRIILE